MACFLSNARTVSSNTSTKPASPGELNFKSSPFQSLGSFRPFLYTSRSLPNCSCRLRSSLGLTAIQKDNELDNKHYYKSQFVSYQSCGIIALYRSMNVTSATWAHDKAVYGNLSPVFRQLIIYTFLQGAFPQLNAPYNNCQYIQN